MRAFYFIHDKIYTDGIGHILTKLINNFLYRFFVNFQHFKSEWDRKYLPYIK